MSKSNKITLTPKKRRNIKVSLHKYFSNIVCPTIPQRKEFCDKLESELKTMGGKLIRYLSKPLSFKDDDLSKYDYINVQPPLNWYGRGEQSYNYMQCFFNIIEKAKKHSCESILYFEDDVCILPHFKYFIPIIMDNAPKYWEMIYFGPGHHGFDDKPSKTYNIETPYLYRSELNLGMQCVAIHSRMFDMLLELKTKPWLNENPYVDITIAHQFHRGNSPHGRRFCYGAFPYLVCETSAFSYNELNDVKRPEYELWKEQLCT